MKNLLTNLKHRLIRNWTFLRMIRVALALFIIVDAWNSSGMLFAALGGLLALQAVFNYGCCNGEVCDRDHRNPELKSFGQTKEITTFEELNNR